MYTYNSRVRFSETDTDRLLSMEGIVNYMQDCSSFQYEDLGASIDYLSSIKKNWILNTWQIVIERRPKVYEQITVGTIPYDYKDIYGYRNFFINDSEGNRCAYANTVWVLLNSDTNMPTKVTEKAVVGYNNEPKLDMDYADRKIIIPKTLESHDPFKVLYNHLDTNLHVNNGKYIRMAMEYLPNDFIVKQMRVQYVKSAVYGDTIVPKIGKIDNKFYVSLDNINNKPYAILEFI